MKTQVFSLLVNNNTGLLSRVAGLFSRRGYNIDSITSGTTMNKSLTLITVVATGDTQVLSQIEKQLAKLEDVVDIKILEDGKSVCRELIMVKIKANAAQRAEVISVADIFKIVNFGSDSKRNFNNLRKFQPTGPLMCGEFWNGWFDHWGEEHHVRGADDTAKEFETMLDMGASVNFYMFHGGTNFNFYNGANHFGTYEPTVTSYDYHCLLNENGDRTEKYYACQNVLKKHGYEVDMVECHDLAKKSYGEVKLTEYAPLFDQLDAFTSHYKKASYTLPMEYLGQNFGFILKQENL